MPDALNVWTDSNEILTLENFGVAFGDKIVLNQLNLILPNRGVHFLLGPTSSGKTTLLRTLCGFNDTNPRLRTWGEAHYSGHLVSRNNKPIMSLQSTELFMATVMQNILFNVPGRSDMTIAEQRDLAVSLLESNGLGNFVEELSTPVSKLSIYENRLLSLLRLSVAGSQLIFLDEPLSAASDEEAYAYLDFVKKIAEERTLLITSHHQRHVQYVDGNISLLAAGRIQESSNIKTFFSDPSTDYGKIYIRSGSCPSPQPPTSENLRKKLCNEHNASEYRAPRGFLWLLQGELAGTPRPGVFADEKSDIDSLTRVGISTLISLTERPPVEPPYDTEALKEAGIEQLLFPIEDMHAPPFELAREICTNIDERLLKRKKVAVNCRAGLGRTGTILASYLIWEGAAAMEAFENIRSINPKWIQSQVQIDFLEGFSNFICRQQKENNQ